ncbi:hypothetical protein CHS0354_006694 [Potamilus streckersoni]|uniref:C-type lectin domain-containing protein n=1 Tax=Potamilus streckersoni TaxID=2493646 RepID=A0AAE0W3P8_9BIVA|nr:hypothetical protein CHS0354_006694 [Potamilus streckersoni]
MIFQGDLSMMLKGDLSMILKGDLSMILKGDLIMILQGDLSMILKRDLSMFLKGDLSMILQERLNMILKRDLSMILKGDLGTILQGDLSMIFQGDLNMILKGDLSMILKGDLSMILKGDLRIIFQGDLSMILKGDLSMILKGDLSMILQGDLSVILKEDLNMILQGDLSMILQGNLSMILKGDLRNHSTLQVQLTFSRGFLRMLSNKLIMKQVQVGFLCLSLLVLAEGRLLRPPLTCPGNYTLSPLSTTTCIRFVNETKSFADARAACQADGGDLLRLNSGNFGSIRQLADLNKGSDSCDFWVGAKEGSTDGVWLYLNGDPLAASSFFNPMTNTVGDGANACGQLSSGDGFYLNDGGVGCVGPKCFICQANRVLL